MTTTTAKKQNSHVVGQVHPNQRMLIQPDAETMFQVVLLGEETPLSASALRRVTFAQVSTVNTFEADAADQSCAVNTIESLFGPYSSWIKGIRDEASPSLRLLSSTSRPTRTATFEAIKFKNPTPQKSYIDRLRERAASPPPAVRIGNTSLRRRQEKEAVPTTDHSFVDRIVRSESSLSMDKHKLDADQQSAATHPGDKTLLVWLVRVIPDGRAI
eukprot:scaffold13866_cov175-Amphora_coffeaeformis.AAC.5